MIVGDLAVGKTTMVHTLMTEKSSKQFDGDYSLGATYNAKLFDIGET